MPKPFDPAALPDDVAQLAADAAAKHAVSVEDIVRAGVENLVADAEDDAAALDVAWENYRKRNPSDPRDMTPTEVLASMHSGGDPERRRAFRAHVDALRDDLRNGMGTSDSSAEMMARINARLGVHRP